MSKPVDVVITWVDGDDPEWLEEKRKYDPKTPLPDSGVHHFRDWGLLRYLFRGIEKNMPWVRTVHFVTWGHLPKWLDTSCPKLHIVTHNDFIPGKYLPTFSSRTIELNFHRIPSLAEKFIYFNDDMYVIKPTLESAFFHNEVPCDLAALNVHCYSLSRPVDLTQVRDVGVINEHFDFHQSLFGNIRKWIRPQNGSALLRTVLLLGCPRFPGFFQTHCAQSLLKSTYDEVWDAEPAILDATCMNKLRGLTDVNQWVMREWQIASGNFYPRNKNFFRPFYLDLEDPIKGANKIATAITRQRYPLICINDAAMTEEELLSAERIIQHAFEEILPDKSCFEL